MLWCLVMSSEAWLSVAETITLATMSSMAREHDFDIQQGIQDVEEVLSLHVLSTG